MDAIRLAGLTPTRAGYDIAPHLPFAHFSLRLPRIGIASEASAMRGYVTPESDGSFVMTVHLPAGIAGARATTWADGVVVAHRSGASLVRFSVTGHHGVPADWAVTWSKAARARRTHHARPHRRTHRRTRP
jgi:hypothetical protein